MSRRAPSRRILSLPEIVQLALESDDYSDTVEDSSGDEYRPGEDEVTDIESDEEIPLQPVGVSQTRRKDTRSYCRECNVGLCYDQCFIDYHTLLQF